MPLSDLLITGREKVLDAVSGSDRARTLNQAAAPGAQPMQGDLAGELVHLLRQVFSTGLADHGETVDYAALRASPLYDDFRHCTGKLHAFDPSALPDRDALLAFWINLYNTLVLDGVIALGVQRSVMERRAGLPLRPCSPVPAALAQAGQAFFRQAAYVVRGQRVSCDDIEHGILRANRGHPFLPGRQFRKADPRLEWVIEPFDARVHFALNCASRSCPPIRVYVPEQLDSQLSLATRSYLAAEVQIVPQENALHLSPIFKWFGADFGGRDGIIEFLLAHLPQGAELLWLSKARNWVSLRYNPYDWSLNSRAQTESA